MSRPTRQVPWREDNDAFERAKASLLELTFAMEMTMSGWEAVCVFRPDSSRPFVPRSPVQLYGRPPYPGFVALYPNPVVPGYPHCLDVIMRSSSLYPPGLKEPPPNDRWHSLTSEQQGTAQEPSSIRMTVGFTKIDWRYTQQIRGLIPLLKAYRVTRRGHNPIAFINNHFSPPALDLLGEVIHEVGLQRLELICCPIDSAVQGLSRGWASLTELKLDGCPYHLYILGALSEVKEAQLQRLEYEVFNPTMELWNSEMGYILSKFKHLDYVLVTVHWPLEGNDIIRCSGAGPQCPLKVFTQFAIHCTGIRARAHFLEDLTQQQEQALRQVAHFLTSAPLTAVRFTFSPHTR